jgi:hypothetical protein
LESGYTVPESGNLCRISATFTKIRLTQIPVKLVRIWLVQQESDQFLWNPAVLGQIRLV